VWWPDGSRIAGLTVGHNGNQEIIVVPFEGGEPTPIEGLRFAGLNYPFDVSPDGRWLATSNGLHFADEIWKLEPAR
jgi:Tol biopolymer transport system component